MRRLSNDKGECLACVGCIEKSNCTCECSAVDDCIEKLSKYEKAEQDGRLVELPCKVGDIVHFIDDIDGVYERSAAVTGIEIDTEGVHIVIPDDETGSVSSYYEPEEFGETIFLTEEALKEGEGINESSTN